MVLFRVNNPNLVQSLWTFARLYGCTVGPFRNSGSGQLRNNFLIFNRPGAPTAVWGINKTCPGTVEILFEQNLPSLMIYVHKNQFQLFHKSNGIIRLTNWITLVHLNSFRPLNLFLHLICVSFKNTLHIKNTLSGVLAVSWRPEILI